MSDRYAAMDVRAAPYARSANWAYIFIVVVVQWYGFQILFSGLFSIWSHSATPDAINTFVTGSTPAAVRWTLATFALHTALLLVMMRLLHNLGLPALIGDTPQSLREFGRVSAYLLPLYAILLVPSLLLPEAEQQFTVARWLALLPTVLPLLFIQISAEEFVFRGYLQSHLAALTAHPIIWIGVPSFLFGMIHFDPTAPAYSAWAYVIWATCLGLVCADLTARSGTLGPALAVHFINNIGALVIFAADDWLYGAALFRWYTYGLPWDPWIPFEAIFLLCIWLSARLALRR